MKKMYLEKLVNSIVVVKLSITLLKMRYRVETGVLNFWRKTFLKSTTLYVSYERTRSYLSANVLF
jgi:hypothetical protein